MSLSLLLLNVFEICQDRWHDDYEGLVVQRSPEKVTEYREGIIKRKGAKAWLDSFSKKQNHIKKWLRPNYIVNYSSNLVNG
jgi:hypothetical protein